MTNSDGCCCGVSVFASRDELNATGEIGRKVCLALDFNWLNYAPPPSEFFASPSSYSPESTTHEKPRSSPQTRSL